MIESSRVSYVSFVYFFVYFSFLVIFLRYLFFLLYLFLILVAYKCMPVVVSRNRDTVLSLHCLLKYAKLITSTLYEAERFPYPLNPFTSRKRVLYGFAPCVRLLVEQCQPSIMNVLCCVQSNSYLTQTAVVKLLKQTLSLAHLTLQLCSLATLSSCFS